MELQGNFCADNVEERGDIVLNYLAPLINTWPRIEVLLPLCPLLKLMQVRRMCVLAACVLCC